MKKILFAFLLYPNIHALFDYDLAILQAQKGNTQKSKELLTKALIESPERADILYDMGTNSYKNGAYDTALAYFNKAAKATKEQILQEQSYFNAGNAHVALKQLQEAIDAYDKVLSLNPQHERALHNKEIVKKMLKQQKQEDKKNQDKQDQNQKDKENHDKDKKDKDQEKEDSQKDKNDQQENESNDKQDQKQDQQQNKQDQNKQNEQDSKQDPADADRQEKLDKQNKDEQEQAQKQQQSQAEKKEKEDAAQNAAEQKNQQAQEQQDQQQSPQQDLSPRMARILNEREKKDAQLNKKMIKAMAGTHAGGKDDYNCW